MIWGSIQCNHSAPKSVSEFSLQALPERKIMTGLPCYACTAGAGFSCGGAVLEE